MEIDKRNRTELKAYFVKNAIPTESNFAEHIDAMLNQKDDGIAKLPGDPLSIEASGDTPQKKAINFYDSFEDAKPAWVLSLNPRTTDTTRAGFDISDSDGASRLFIDRLSGNVGIGTIEPLQTLDVRGRINVGSGVIQRGGAAITATSDLGLYSGVAGHWIRIVSTNAPIRFFTDGGTGSSMKLSVESGGVSVWGGLAVNGDHRANGNLASTGEIRAQRLVGDTTALGAFTTADRDEWPLVTWLRDTAAGWDEGLIKHSAVRGVFRKQGFGIHLHESRSFGFFSTNWDPLMELTGGPDGQEEVYFKGFVRAPAGLHIAGNRSTHMNNDGAFYRFGGQAYITVDDNLYIRDSIGGIKFHFNTNTGVLVQEGWKTPGFQSGWVNYSSTYNNAGYFKDSMGIVHLRGLVKNGAIRQPIFTLPAGYRPPRRELFVVMTHPDVAGRVDVLTDGRVWPNTGNSGWISLDGLTFRAA